MSLSANQRVFQVRNDENNSDNIVLQEVSRVRRLHEKSRNGCQACKNRRIKCDEVMPRCSYCQRHREGFNCVYPTTRHVFESNLGITPPATLMHDLSMEMVQSDVDKPLGSLLHKSLACNSASDTVHAMHHFRNVTSKTLGSSEMQNVMFEWVPQSAWQQPFIMHMILALSFAHLRLLGRTSLDRSYALLEAIHWQHGLRNYRVALSSAGPTTSQEQGDALVTGTLLSMYYTNCLEETVSLEAFNTDYDSSVNSILTSLAVSHGMSVLRRTLGTFMSASAFSPVFRPRPPCDPDVADDLSISLVLDRICRLHNANAISKGLIRRVADILVRMMSPYNIENDPDLILSFGGVAYPELQLLLAERSPEVMMLLLCWFASLARTDQWWANARMKSQSDALKNYLISVAPPGDDLNA